MFTSALVALLAQQHQQIQITRTRTTRAGRLVLFLVSCPDLAYACLGFGRLGPTEAHLHPAHPISRLLPIHDPWLSPS